jgi:hypothetical protein
LKIIGARGFLQRTEIKRLFAALENLVSPEAPGPRLKEPNHAFDSSTPLQVIERPLTSGFRTLLSAFLGP